MRAAIQLLLLVFLGLNCRAQVIPILRNTFTTNTFDAGVSGAIPYFDYPSGKFVATGIVYTNGLYFEPTLGFLTVSHTNSTGELLLVLAEGGPAGPSIQAYSDRLVVANTNLSFDAVGPFGIQWRVDGSNVLQSAAGGVSLSGKTNVVGDSGASVTYNGGSILQPFYYGGQYGFGATSITPTNIRSSNLPSGNTDIYTVPAGKRFLIQNFNASLSTNTASVACYSLLKTNSVYYRITTSSSVVTNLLSGLLASENLFLEAGESASINTVTAGVNVALTGLLFPSSVNVYTARSLSLVAGTNLLYICPAGKVAIDMPLPQIFAGNSQPFATYINDSGSSRVISINIIPSGSSLSAGNRISSRTVTDKNASSWGCQILFPGDAIVITTDASAASQWARVTVAEIPFP